jgi:hypothetical protein
MLCIQDTVVLTVLHSIKLTEGISNAVNSAFSIAEYWLFLRNSTNHISHDILDS